MNIRNLSLLTGINAETIRSYRIKGLLKPGQKQNGYYNYSIEDYIALIHLRKLRGFSMSLDMISRYYQTENESELISMIEEEQSELHKQMAQMELELRLLEFEKRHIRQVGENGLNIYLLDAIDEKIDYYNMYNSEYFRSHKDLFPDIYAYTSPTLRITKEILNGECSAKMIPIQAGIGTYRHIIKDNSLPMPPDDYTIIPKAHCLCQIITLSRLDQMNLLTLKPLMDYAKQNNYVFISDTTGYLLRVQIKENQTQFRFRIRAAVEKRD
ncbi:MAG: MerR family transcriptional regulator [Erysipelotrichaceae bacterium]|nr:MerR family transcriptional regulator [Erysipelotrichaceae bacterium]